MYVIICIYSYIYSIHIHTTIYIVVCIYIITTIYDLISLGSLGFLQHLLRCKHSSFCSGPAISDLEVTWIIKISDNLKLRILMNIFFAFKKQKK